MAVTRADRAFRHLAAELSQDVIRQGLERATQTLRGVTAGWPSTTPEGGPGQILDETTASAEAFRLA